jgi:hypothetical protein
VARRGFFAKLIEGIVDSLKDDHGHNPRENTER